MKNIDSLVEKVWRYCEENNIRGRTVTVKIKYADFKKSAAAPSIYWASGSGMASVATYRRGKVRGNDR